MKVILFNGEDEVIVTHEQIKEMGKNSPRELVSYFQATTIYRDVMKDLIKENGKAILNINDEELTELRIKLVESGYQTISAELVSVFGEDSAAMIMAETYNAINLEKNGRIWRPRIYRSIRRIEGQGHRCIHGHGAPLPKNRS